MERTHRILFVGILTLFLTGGHAFAQRVVVRRPGVTVVRPGRPVVAPYRGVAHIRVVRALPRAAVAVSFAGTSYYYGAGLYYRYYGGNYVLVPAPIGFRLAVLPVGYSTVWVNGSPYYYFQGNYYQTLEGTAEFVVVTPPKEAVLDTLPEGAQQVEINGNSYYEYGGTLYKVVLVPDGKAFKVVGDLDEKQDF